MRKIQGKHSVKSKCHRRIDSESHSIAIEAGWLGWIGGIAGVALISDKDEVFLDR